MSAINLIAWQRKEGFDIFLLSQYYSVIPQDDWTESWSQISYCRPNNRIHSDTQSQGVFCFCAVCVKTLLLPSFHWLWAQVMRTNPAVRIKLGAIGVIFGKWKA
jgi:hypothetical protein